MHQQDVLRAWVAGLTKTGTEQEKVDRLADVLDGLLAFPKARTLSGFREYETVRKQARDMKPHGPGVDTLTHALIDLSCQLERKELARVKRAGQQQLENLQAELAAERSKGFWAKLFNWGK